MLHLKKHDCLFICSIIFLKKSKECVLVLFGIVFLLRLSCSVDYLSLLEDNVYEEWLSFHITVHVCNSIRYTVEITVEYCILISLDCLISQPPNSNFKLS